MFVIKYFLLATLVLSCLTLAYCFDKPDSMDDQEYLKILRQFAGDDVDPKASIAQIKAKIKKKYGGDVQMGFSDSKGGEPIKVGFSSDEL